MKLDEYRVRGRRERLGLTLAMLAQKAGTSKNTILSAEHGGDIRPTTARKIAEALDVEIDALLGETASPLAEAPPSAEQPPLNGFLAEEWRKEEELAAASITALAEEGERLEEDLKEVVEGIPTGGFLQFFAAHNLARLLYEEWSRNRQASTELSDAKERLDAVGKRMDPLIRQLIHPGSGAAASERNMFASMRDARNRQENERLDERIRENKTA